MWLALALQALSAIIGAAGWQAVIGPTSPCLYAVGFLGSFAGNFQQLAVVPWVQEGRTHPSAVSWVMDGGNLGAVICAIFGAIQMPGAYNQPAFLRIYFLCHRALAHFDRHRCLWRACVAAAAVGRDTVYANSIYAENITWGEHILEEAGVLQGYAVEASLLAVFVGSALSAYVPNRALRVTPTLLAMLLPLLLLTAMVGGWKPFGSTGSAAATLLVMIVVARFTDGIVSPLLYRVAGDPFPESERQFLAFENPFVTYVFRAAIDSVNIMFIFGGAIVLLYIIVLIIIYGMPYRGGVRL